MAFNSNKISALAKCFFKQKLYFIKFFIVDFLYIIIIRLTNSKNLKLISRINIIKSDKELKLLNEYTDLFEE